MEITCAWCPTERLVPRGGSSTEVNRRIIEALLDSRAAPGQGPPAGSRPRALRRRLPRDFTTRVAGCSDACRSATSPRCWASSTPGSGTVARTTTTRYSWSRRVSMRPTRMGPTSPRGRTPTWTVDRAEIVKQLFGAADLDPRMSREAWLPTRCSRPNREGVARARAVLTRDAAVRALVGASTGRLRACGGDAGTSGPCWRGHVPLPAQRGSSHSPRRNSSGLTGWLAENVGGAAVVLMALAAAAGRAKDAMPLGGLRDWVGEPARERRADAALGFGSLSVLNTTEKRQRTAARSLTPLRAP